MAFLKIAEVRFNDPFGKLRDRTEGKDLYGRLFSTSRMSKTASKATIREYFNLFRTAAGDFINARANFWAFCT